MRRISPVVQINPNAMGNAWFIETIKTVNTNREELDAIDTVDLRLTAFVHKEFEDDSQRLRSGQEWNHHADFLCTG